MIQSSEIGSLETRASFRDGDIMPQIVAGEPILFMPCDISDNDLWSYGRATYDLRLYGTLENGEKACVRISDAPLYFDYDVSVHNTEWRLSAERIANDPQLVQRIELEGIVRMRALLTERDQYTKTSGLSAAWQYPMHGFTLEKHLYIRVAFKSLQDRSKCIRTLREVSLALIEQNPNLLAHDDTGFNSPAYFNALAREYHILPAGWNIIQNYSHNFDIKRDAQGREAAQIHNFVVSINNIKPAPAPKTEVETARRLHDRILSESWDIEVEHESPGGGIPNVGDNYTITTISLVYAYSWSDVPLVRYVLSVYPCAAPAAAAAASAASVSRTVFIICRNEADLISTRARIAQRMQPDIRIAFNGANFDWKLFNDKAQRYGLCSEILQCMDLTYIPRESRASAGAGAFDEDHYVREAFRRKFVAMRVKINAENTHDCACVALLAGTLDIDIMPAMRRIFKNEEVKFAESLNKYLAKAGLPPKDDVYFKVMLRMFQRARALQDPHVPRACHCDAMDSCPLCQGARVGALESRRGLVRELDFAVVNPSEKMDQWHYRDGHDGGAAEPRDPSLARCCACGLRPQNERDIRMINDYCAIDSVRPLQLLRKLGVTGDNRELSNTTYTSLFDSYYHADGMRVVNFTGSFAPEFGIAISARAPERPKARFQGAHVFPPVLGIHDRPVTALDFSSLYPSLILAYNISPDMIVTSHASADALARMGYELHHIEPFEYEEISGASSGPSSGASASAAVIKKKAVGWTIRHGGVLAPHRAGDSTRPQTVHYDTEDKEIRGRPALDREHLGLFGFALRFLLDARKAVRADQGRIADQIKAIIARVSGQSVKDIELDMPKVEDQALKVFRMHVSAGHIREDEIPKLGASVSELALRWQCLESKQKALKVLANTFYGQMGSNLSVCYTLVGAAGVTAAGRYNILRVAAMLRELGYVIVYGDTDSVYTRAPESIYAAIDADWMKHGPPEATNGAGDGTMTMRDYWGRQVIAAREDMERLRLRVSAFLRADNGTRFLNMAYEEVGMPSAFFGKKKYILRPHIKGVMFEAKAMVRGLETVKQGRAPIVKKMGESIIEDILAIRQGKSIIDIVLSRVNEYYSGANGATMAPTQDLGLFIQFKTYKPAKRNIPVNRFVERMRERYAQLMHDQGAAAAAPYTPPEPGDKFQYVIVERDTEVSLGGHCVTYKVGDKMEYPIAVTSGRARIDRKHYMDGALMSLFARFISSDPRFGPENAAAAGDGTIVPHFDPENDYTPYDEWRQDRAVRFLQEACARFDTTDMAHVRAVASRQRSTTGAFCTVIQKAAREVNLTIEPKIAQLLVHDRMREISRGRPGDRITDEMIQALVSLIFEVAAEKSLEAEISENEAIESYATSLERVYTPTALAERYSREHYTRHIIAQLGATRDRVQNEIKMDYAARLIAMYRSKHIDEVLSGIATNAVESGLKGKAKLMPEIGRRFAFDHGTLDLLHNLSHQMTEYSAAEFGLRREAMMRERYATDKGAPAPANLHK